MKRFKNIYPKYTATTTSQVMKNKEDIPKYRENIDVYLPDIFKGHIYRLANNWFRYVNIDEFIHRPINYLEIGALHGANLLSVAQTYASHEQSKLFVIDPWEDYDDYPEYKGEIASIYDTFIQNIETSNVKDKIIIKRGYSHSQVPTLDNNFFDIIYIDGNHEPNYILEDAVLCFRKLKKNGILIFDDYGWCEIEIIKKSIDSFIACYHAHLEYIGIKDGQVFIRKTTN
jgi:hypothetical protein